ncbi:MAG: hypothetical protein U1E81_02755 [Xanthobacteraceae bacterium]
MRDKYCEPIGKFSVQEKERRWRLSSAMQKSFRRREQEWLELYLSGLLALDPAYAWSRFATVVMEDASTAISGFRETYAAFLWLSTAKHRRREFGVTNDDLIRFARFFHDFGRCRAACDTIYSIHNEPAWSDLKNRVAGGDLAEFQAMDAPLATKLALAAAGGHDRQTLLAGLLSAAHPIDRWIAMKGLTMHEGSMAVVYPAIVAEDDSEFEIDEAFPPSVRIGDYPGYAFDIHVRDGIAALRCFLKMSDVPFVSQFLDLLRGDRQKAVSVLGDLLFWAEIGLLSRRRAASTPSYGYRASQRCLYVCTRRANIPDKAVPDLIQLLREAIPALNDARLRLVKP